MPPAPANNGDILFNNGTSANLILAETATNVFTFGTGSPGGVPSSVLSMQRQYGNVGIAGCLTYNGGTLGTCLSDARTKKNISPFRTGLQQIVGLTPITYEYNGLGESAADGKVRTGLLAQDVQAVAPDLVQTTNIKSSPAKKDDKPLLAVKYGDLTFALINAVKELKAANDNQSAEIGTLNKEVAVLQRKLAVQSARNEEPGLRVSAKLQVVSCERYSTLMSGSSNLKTI